MITETKEELYIGIHLCYHCNNPMRRYEFIRGTTKAMRYICDRCKVYYPVYYENSNGEYVDYYGRSP